MQKKTVWTMIFTLFSASLLTLAFNVQPVRASGTIYIRPDGAVEGTDKILREGNLYTFTDDIYDSIVVERDNIVVDGAGHTLQGTGGGNGTDLIHRSNVTIKNLEIKSFFSGIMLISSSNNIICGNTVTNNECGIYLDSSSHNTISGNNMTNTWVGIHLYGDCNTVYGNNIRNNALWGVYLYASSNNIIYHNNFMDNSQQAKIHTICSANLWDDGYPSGGNYWSDYSGVDADGDGIGDTPYVIDANNQDRHPLMSRWVGEAPVEREVGVEVGDWAKYNVDTSWTGGLSPYLEVWTEMEWGRIEVTDVQGTVVTFTGTSHFTNGSELTGTGRSLDVAPTGSFGFIFYFIGANLHAGDKVYPSGVMTINETVTRTYCAVPRENNHLNWATSFSVIPDPYDLNEFDCYWDQATGILTEELLEGSTEDLSSTLSIHLQMVDTNLWEAPIPTTINDLKTKIEELGSKSQIDNQGVVRGLLAKLNVAQRLVDKGKIDEAKSILEEDFIAQVRNLTSVHITVEAADLLVESAEYIIAHL